MNEQQQGRTCSCAALMPGECICGAWDEQQQGAIICPSCGHGGASRMGSMNTEEQEIYENTIQPPQHQGMEGKLACAMKSVSSLGKTPRTDQAFLGDASVGQLPLVQKWHEAVEFARTLERELLDTPPQQQGREGELIKAAENMDWQQVVGNGGPPCFRLCEDGNFCGRAQRWDGHRRGDSPNHEFLSLADLLRANLPAEQGEGREVDSDSMIGKLAAARASRDLHVERIAELEMDIETWRAWHAELEKRCANLRAAGKLAAEESVSAHTQLRELQGRKNLQPPPRKEQSNE